MPMMQTVKQSQKELCAAFGLDLPLDLLHCEEIWKKTAEHLFWHRTESLRSEEVLPEICIPQALQIKLENPLDAEAILLPKKLSWKAWAANAASVLELALHNKRPPLLRIGASFVPKKPNLYRVERILSGIDSDYDLWLTQLVVFVLSYCRNRNIRPILDVECRIDKLHELFRICASFAPLPHMILKPTAGIAWSDYAALCDSVMKNACGKEEGIPPILLPDTQKVFEN